MTKTLKTSYSLPFLLIGYFNYTNGIRGDSDTYAVAIVPYIIRIYKQMCIRDRFKGVHYEMTVLCGGYEFLVQDYHHFEVGVEVGLLVKPFDIHIMKKERVCNTFEGKMLDATRCV